EGDGSGHYESGGGLVPPIPSAICTPDRAPLSLRLHFGLSSTILCPGTPLLQLHLIPPALSGSFTPPAPPWSSGPAPPRPPGSTPPRQSPETSVPPRPSGSSSSPGSLSSPRASPPPTPLPSVGPLESSALPPPWLLPLSVPLWVIIMAVAWVPPGSSFSKSLLSPTGPAWSLLSSPLLLPPSGCPGLSCCLPGSSCFLLSSSLSRLHQDSVHCPPPKPLPKFPPMAPSVVVYGTKMRLQGGGRD
ncbi:hypothetical protein M9458_039958, partial [Cirrhinus mrigala]